MNVLKFACIGLICARTIFPVFAQSDGDENPLIPMGAITGKPDAQFIKKTLESFKEVGITQYMIYPRSGLELEYMSKEYLDVCENVCATAKGLGFTSLWLYDEFNWPSGTANKQVMKENPEYIFRHLNAVKNPDGSFEIAMRENPEMANLLEPAAVECFIRLTHEKYAKRLGSYMGTLIKGIFTDEPSAGYFEWRKYGAEKIRVPYYDGIEADYKRMTGGDLKSDMLLGAQTSTAPYEEAVNKLVAKRFSSNYAKRISDWCASHSMVLTGHLMDEYFSSKALQQNGNPLKVLSEFSFPAIDDIFTPDNFYDVEWLTYSTGMYAIQKRGNKGGLVELFAIGPTDMPYQKLRRQIWLAATFGITRYAFLAPLDARGNAVKQNYYTSFSPVQPWFGYMKELGNDAKIAAKFAAKEQAEPIVEVRYPYKPCNLTWLLKSLAADQYSWRLIAPEDVPSAPVVLKLDGDQIIDERTKQSFWEYPMLRKNLLAKFARKLQIENPDGTLAANIFTRSYKDDSAVVINFSQETRNLLAVKAGKKIPLKLYPRGVEILPAWKVELDSPNFARAEFENSKFKFELSDDMDVFLLSLAAPSKSELLLDGVKIEPQSPCQSLTSGIKELYFQTKLSLKKGEHLLEIKNPENDFPYLPAAIFAGKFSQNGSKFSPYKNDGKGLYGYAGSIVQSSEIKIPEGAQLIKIAESELPTEVFINCKSIGRRAWAPFEWRIPAELAGNFAKIKIIRQTPVSRIFGTKSFNREKAHKWLISQQPTLNSKPIEAPVECFFE